MSVAAALYSELEHVVQHGSTQRRTETLRRIAALFLNNAPNLNDDHVAVFDDVMTPLMEEMPGNVLAQLAQRLVRIPNAPYGVMSKLALNDDIEVARPLLQYAYLADYDLLKIAQTKSQAHLLVLSSRIDIDETLAETLLAHGSREVALSLAGNNQANLSENAFINLVKKAEQDSPLAEKLLKRRDVPPRFFRELWMRARGTSPKLPAANQMIASRVSSDEINENIELTESDVVACANAGKYEETVAALAQICTIPLEVINRLMSGNRLDPLLILGRAAGFSWATIRALIGARPGPKPTEEMLSAASEYYRRVTISAAERVVRFWQVNQGSAVAGREIFSR